MTHLEEKVPADIIDRIIKHLKSFINAMDNDFNTSVALSLLFDCANHAQRAKDAGNFKQSAFCVAFLLKLSDILGFDFSKTVEIQDELVPQLMDVILSVRTVARNQKKLGNF